MTFGEIKEILSEKTVGIAGAGGLGSNCAIALARVGVGKIIIADFDVVSVENLNRQYFFTDQVGKLKVFAVKENIKRINPLTEVITHDKRLTPLNIPEIFQNCDVMVEAFDLAGQKQMLIESFVTEFPEMPLVAGLGVAGWGMNDLIHFRRMGNIYICGDEISEIDCDVPPIAPRVGIVANMQANTVLQILLGEMKNDLKKID